MDYNWTECGVAYGDLKHRFSNHNPLTIKKAIVGMILASELPAVCADYSETALVYLTDEHAAKSVDPWGSHNSGNAPPFDFWRYGMATRPDSDACFVSGNFGNELPMLAGDLPYRFFKSRFERGSSPSDLYQSARGVSLSVPHLESLFADRRWSNVWPKKAEPKPPGLKKSWLWDEVKAALTVTIAKNPELLNGNASKIVAEMESLFDIIQPLGGSPDRRDLFSYASKIIAQGQMPEPAP